MNTKKIVWRLKERPTPLEIIELKKAGLLKDDEAREILFSSEDVEEPDKKALESEIKFLREMVQKLSNGSNTRIVEIIQEVHRPYYVQTPWYLQYQVWCSSLQNTQTLGGSTGYNNVGSAINAVSGSSSLDSQMTSSLQASAGPTVAAFSEIKTW